MDKQTLILEAYGNLWEKVKDFVDTDGWCSDKQYNKIDCPRPPYGFEYEQEYWRKDDGERIVDVYAWRPIELQGIEDNNGWNIIDEKLPEDNITVFWLNNENGEFETASLCHVDFDSDNYTHWHELPPKPPLY